MLLKRFWDSSLSPLIVALVVLALAALPAWIPLIRRKFAPSTTYRFALYLTAISQILQACFVLIGLLFPLSDPSPRRFAVLGLPLCIAGAGLAYSSLVSDRRGGGCLLSALFTGFLWLFWITAH